MLGQDLDAKVQLYLKKVREGGGAVSARIVMEAARDIMLTCDRPKLVEFKGHVQLNRHWAHSLLKRCSTEGNHCQEQTKCCKFQRAKEIVSSRLILVTMEEIPPELILNWDQTGIKMVPCSTWTMDRQSAKRGQRDDGGQRQAANYGRFVGRRFPSSVADLQRLNNVLPPTV